MPPLWLMLFALSEKQNKDKDKKHSSLEVDNDGCYSILAAIVDFFRRKRVGRVKKLQSGR
jgi:hypothetical protein